MDGRTANSYRPMEVFTIGKLTFSAQETARHIRATRLTCMETYIIRNMEKIISRNSKKLIIRTEKLPMRLDRAHLSRS